MSKMTPFVFFLIFTSAIHGLAGNPSGDEGYNSTLPATTPAITNTISTFAVNGTEANQETTTPRLSYVEEVAYKTILIFTMVILMILIVIISVCFKLYNPYFMGYRGESSSFRYSNNEGDLWIR